MIDVEKILGKEKKVRPKTRWHSTCCECGGLMDYYNFKYCCRKCGNVLEV